MCAICHWPSHKGEAFEAITEWHANLLLEEFPFGTDIIHFCRPAWSLLKWNNRCVLSKWAKVYEVSGKCAAPDPQEFFTISSYQNIHFELTLWKVVLLWTAWTLAWSKPSVHWWWIQGRKTRALFSQWGLRWRFLPLDLHNRHEEAVTRVLLYTFYNRVVNRVDRVVIHANATDVTSTSHWSLRAVGEDSPESEHIDTAGKKHPANALTDDSITRTRELTMDVYNTKADQFKDSDLGKLRV